MIPEAVQSLPQGATSIILIGLLIAVLVVAYKIMEKVFETVTVAALSGAFYAGLTYLFSGGSMTGFKIDELLLFAFLGATLYMVYSFAISLYRAGTTLAEIPIKLAKALIYPFKKLWSHHQKARKNEQKKEKDQRQDEQSTKEVVLDNVKDDEEDE
ncbi:hypothetical protein AQV86_04110 [Nanohaloarchaea archaeon SG9]|nr:hypothetical protein AQV86_04110 [Nanohaloarchaea archaeon SG9]